MVESSKAHTTSCSWMWLHLEWQPPPLHDVSTLYHSTLYFMVFHTCKPIAHAMAQYMHRNEIHMKLYTVKVIRQDMLEDKKWLLKLIHNSNFQITLFHTLKPQLWNHTLKQSQLTPIIVSIPELWHFESSTNGCEFLNCFVVNVEGKKCNKPVYDF